MRLPPGTRLGPYEIRGTLGAGGMGEVYRAVDTNLGRGVAVKVLPEAFAQDPERLARFEREARTLASLNHPNIAIVHGFERADGIPALVMELVDGPTLADRIATSPVPLKEALSIAGQIAGALDAAHGHGVIHRDLKPSNIKVTAAGTVKVLDFGLAKALGPPQHDVHDLTASPTNADPAMTQAGAILGTAAYMSPEQAGGHHTDKRTDIWAFGCVLYEMLTGGPAFQGASATETLARVFERDPDWNRLPADLPPRIDEILRRCLEKDPKKRRRDIGDVRIEIEQASSAPPQPAAPLLRRASSRRLRLAWIITAVLVAALAITMARPYFSRPTGAPETLVEVTTPQTPELPGFAISRDGRRLVFVAFRDGQAFLYVRSLDSDAAQPLSGTEGARMPFWSPDGRSVGFFASGELKRVDINDGRLQTLAQVSPGMGGTWGNDGVILFAPRQGGPLFRVPASGGETVAVTTLAPGQVGHWTPSFLPGDRRFLFRAVGNGEAPGIYLGSLDSPDAVRLIDAASKGEYAPPGWLLFARQGALVARRFDPVRREISDEPVTVAKSVHLGNTGAAFSTSATGTIAYRTGGSTPRQLTWFDRSGKVLGTLAEPDRANLLNPALSRDGRQVAVTRDDVQNNRDIWLLDASRTSRFSTDAGVENHPTWSPDGTRIAYSAGSTLYQKASSGAGDPEPLFASTRGKFPNDWYGRFLMYHEVTPTASSDLWVLPIEGDRKPFQFLATNSNEAWGQFSPDGRWVAYQSNESGERFEVYVRPFPGADGRWQISTSGGVQPRWSRNGNEVFYIAPNGTLMATAVAVKGAAIEAGAPIALFQPHIVGGGGNIVGNRQQYDVTRDGRFLINVETETAPPPITLILNWKSKL